MKIYFFILAILASIVFLFVIEVYQFGYENYLENQGSKDEFNIGTLGDFIGGLTNPALSFISFIALLSTIFISIKSQKLQSFDATFNSLLEQHNRILNNLKSSTPENDFQSPIEKSIEFIKKAPTINDARNYLINNDHYCDTYLRLVYQILNLIVHRYPRIIRINVYKDQKRYSNILRAIIDQETLFLIAINAASTKETPSFDSYKVLIERTNFLEHLKPLKQFQPIISEIANIYKESAFGESIYKDEIFSVIKPSREKNIKKSYLIKEHIKIIILQFKLIFSLIVK